MTPPNPSRSAGLDRLNAFVPCARAYAEQRNYDRDGHADVSRLSPYVQRRMVGEWEVVEGVLDRFAPSAVDKFVQEVLWRTYWKGWLQMRPQVWEDYLEAVERDLDSMQGYIAKQYEAATRGETGIACFDHWVRELVETGYVHNHARMWFASIWCFTFNLPWTLGADFFFRHLLDADAASNTLSWRWVAGLQTRGKHYVARASNIAKYTDGRFDPAGQLHESPAPIEDATSYGKSPLPEADALPASGRLGLLLHGNDLLPEHGPLAGTPFVAVAGGSNLDLVHRYRIASLSAAFSASAMDDALERTARHLGVPGVSLDASRWSDAVVEWAAAHHLSHVVALDAPIGPWAEAVEQVGARLRDQAIPLLRIRRAWDAMLWPHATKGFFHFREQMRPLLQELLPAARI